MPTLGQMLEAGGAGEDVTKTLDEVAAALGDLNLKKLGKNTDELTAAQIKLRDQLGNVYDQARENLKEINIQHKKGKISHKQREKQYKAQAKLLTSLNNTIKDETSNRAAGVKELTKMASAAENMNKALNKSTGMLRKMALGSMRVIKEQKRSVKEWVKNKKRYEDLGESLEGLGNKVDYFGSSLVAAAGRKFKETKLGKSRKGMATMGLTAAIIAGLMKVVQMQGKNLKVAAPRAFNYGWEGGNIDRAISVTGEAMAEISAQSSKLGLGIDGVSEGITEIAAQTGVSITDKKSGLLAASRDMFQVVQAGAASSSEVYADMTDRINSTGMSAAAAASELKGVALQAKALQRVMGKDGAIQMDDLYKSVKNIAGAIDALAVSHKDLASGLAFAIKASDKLGLSYNRRIKLAERLIKGVTADYDPGFAILNIKEELKIAMAAGSKDAARIKKLMEGGMDVAMASKMFEKAEGGASGLGVMKERLRRTALASVSPGGMRMVEAQIGEVASVDTAEFLQKLGKGIQKGRTIDAIMQDISVTKKDKEIFEKVSKQIGERQQGAKDRLEIALKKIGSKFSTMLEPLLSSVTKLLEGMDRLMGLIGGIYENMPPWMKKGLKTTMPIVGMVTEDDTAKKAAKKSTGRSWGTEDDTAKKGTQNTLRDKAKVSSATAKGSVSAAEAYMAKKEEDTKRTNEIVAALLAKQSGGGTITPTDVTMKGGRVRGDGAVVGKGEVTFTQTDATRVAEAHSTLRAGQARATSKSGAGAQ